MADLLNTGLAWLDAQRKAHCTQTVLYRRGVEETTLVATVGRTDYDAQDSDGRVVRSRVTDFLITAADLPVAEPRAGDQLDYNGRTFEVLPLGPEGCWRWSDPQHHTVRVHTRDVADQT